MEFGVVLIAGGGNILAISLSYGGKGIRGICQRFQAEELPGEQDSSDPLFAIFQGFDNLHEAGMKREEMQGASAFEKQDLIAMIPRGPEDASGRLNLVCRHAAIQ